MRITESGTPKGRLGFPGKSIGLLCLLMAWAPGKLHAQSCPDRPGRWRTLQVATHPQLPLFPGESASQALHRVLERNRASVFGLYRPVPVSSQMQLSAYHFGHSFFQFLLDYRSTLYSFQSSVRTRAYTCENVPRRTPESCVGPRLFLDIEQMTGPLTGKAKALVIDFCAQGQNLVTRSYLQADDQGALLQNDRIANAVALFFDAQARALVRSTVAVYRHLGTRSGTP